LRAPEALELLPSVQQPAGREEDAGPHRAPTTEREDNLRIAQRVAHLKSELLATGHVKSRSVRTVACEMVARESGRTWETVNAAERRGRKAPGFSEVDLPDSARQPLRL